MSILSGQMMQQKMQRLFFCFLFFFSKKQKPFLHVVFNQLHCDRNSTRLSQNARIKPSVIKLDSCKKRAPEHK